MRTTPFNPPIATFTIGLADLRGAWLELACCGATRCIPVAALLRQGVAGSLGAALVRLRCERCRGHPEAVALTDRPDKLSAARRDAPLGWRVAVVE